MMIFAVILAISTVFAVVTAHSGTFSNSVGKTEIISIQFERLSEKEANFGSILLFSNDYVSKIQNKF